MKPFLFCLFLSIQAAAATPDIILDEVAVANMNLAFAEAEEATFEETIFALGGIEVLPGKRAVVSSRIPGRAFSVLVIPHQEVDAGVEVAWVESRQPGDPPCAHHCACAAARSRATGCSRTGQLSSAAIRLRPTQICQTSS